MSPIKLGAATLNQTPLDWEKNISNIKQAIHLAREDNVDLLCLQELTITSYGCQDMFLADWVLEKAALCLKELLPFTRGLTVVIGLPWKQDGEIFNCVALIENGSVLGISAKQNLPDDGVYYEPRWFKPWPAGKKIEIKWNNKKIPFGEIIYDYKGKKLAFEICEDAWRGEKRPACRYVKENVDIILNPSASHFEFGKTKFRERLTSQSSSDFNCTFVFANQCGNEAGRLIYEGDMLIATRGKIQKRNRWLSFRPVQMISCFMDAPEEVFSEPAENFETFTQAASLALYDYLRKSHSRGYTISLSGGADSSTCATLVAEMVKRGIYELGKDPFLESLGRDELKGKGDSEIIKNLLTCVYQGTSNSSEVTRNAASTLAKDIGADFHQWNIDEELSLVQKKIEGALNRSLDWDKDDITLQNVQARMRSPLIWMLANARNQLLIATSNRSEGDVGYTTMDGDTSGGISPLADLDKPFIREWLKWAENTLEYSALSLVNVQEPTAELRPGNQTDEDDLMPYDMLLKIERLAIHQKKSPIEIWKILRAENPEELALKNHIAKFFRLWAASQWKRERLAPAFHFDHFNIDPKTWMRFPILSGGFTAEIEELLRDW